MLAANSSARGLGPHARTHGLPAGLPLPEDAGHGAGRRVQGGARGGGAHRRQARCAPPAGALPAGVRGALQRGGAAKPPCVQGHGCTPLQPPHPLPLLRCRRVVYGDRDAQATLRRLSETLSVPQLLQLATGAGLPPPPPVRAPGCCRAAGVCWISAAPAGTHLAARTVADAAAHALACRQPCCPQELAELMSGGGMFGGGVSGLEAQARCSLRAEGGARVRACCRDVWPACPPVVCRSAGDVPLPTRPVHLAVPTGGGAQDAARRARDGRLHAPGQPAPGAGPHRRADGRACGGRACGRG